jgi:hypothetical protein
MTPEVAEHLPIIVGALAVIGAGVISILKSYRWLIGEIRAAIGDAMKAHEGAESEWQRAIEDRLDRIETKVDRLTERE